MVQKKMRNTAEFLIECLEEEGVHYIFGIPGEENLAIINALEHSKIELSPSVMNRVLPSWPMSTAD